MRSEGLTRREFLGKTSAGLVAMLSRPASGLARQRYPGVAWQRAGDASKLGWSREKLQAAREFSSTLATE